MGDSISSGGSYARPDEAGGKIVEIDEVAARVVRTYWALLLAMTVLPVVLVGLVMGGQEPPHSATSRLQASSRATDAAAGDAGVSIVVSQVKAFATGRTLLDRVLREQRIVRDPVKLAKEITVAGLGTSTVVELTIKDPDAAVARRLTDALGAAVVAEINQSNQGAITQQLAAIEKRIRELEGQLGPLSRRAGAVPVPDIGAANERERVAAELSDLRTSRSELRTDLTTAGTATVVQPAVLAERTNPVVMLAAIAGLVGLVGGVLVAVVAEMFRPTVPGQSRAARRLGVPLLGRADGGEAEAADLGRRIRLAARRAGVERVVLVSTGGPLPAELLSRIAAAAYGDDAGVLKAAPAEPEPEAEADAAPHDESGDGEPGGNVNSTVPASGGGTSVVRAGSKAPGSGTAVIARRSGEPARTAAEPARRPAAARRATIQVHAFEDIDTGADDGAGVVAVAGPVTPVPGLESVRDLVSASGWPLLGVVATDRKITGRRKRAAGRKITANRESKG
ncbi:hypothetical protein [Actinomadura rugatobispora]|uniref:Polysaccharide chain length determinant N-terminal domain-containing protein n=1 Tax=Actinomadura rugatobispora TaxID=1994 RepID=A0ABW0ZNF0_9ACTN|nr:hypothetical protein GCM10010200_058960 [Actinomadura rugatobispora]